MAAPKQVRRAARAAERQHREAYTPEPEEGGEVVELAPEPAPEPEPEPEVPEPEAAAESAPEPVPEPAPEPEPEPEEDWEQRYKVLQGKYNAEVPRYARELREVREQLDARTQILARLDEARQAPEPAQPSSATGGATITAEERADYGEDFLDVVARQAQLAMAPQLEQLQQTLARMDQGVGNVARRVQQSDQERVMAYLDSNVPEWQRLNDDDQFLTWLEQRDRFTGRQRRELLTEAYNAFDASRVAAFFTSYQEENAAVAPAPSNPPSPPRSGKVPMSQLVAPGTPREAAGSASAQDGKRTWTQADIAAFYSEVQRGRYRDAEADKLAIEKDIVAAAAEGRIIG